MKSLSCILPSATPWTVGRQAPLSMGFSRQGYWSGLPFPAPGDFPDSGTEPGSPALLADSLPSVLPGKPKSIETGMKENEKDRGEESLGFSGLLHGWKSHFHLVPRAESWDMHIQL